MFHLIIVLFELVKDPLDRNVMIGSRARDGLEEFSLSNTFQRSGAANTFDGPS